MLKGWRLRPKRVKYLFLGMWLSALARLRHWGGDDSLPRPTQFPAPPHAEGLPLQAAA
jgi:hypothetical protein